jgi:uncharacterized phage protein (TIGR02220 family)
MKENPNYYGILPAFVRYSKEVCSSSKLLYTELTALSNKEGYCYANNGYFAELYGVSEKSISNWIKELVTAGFIRSEVTKNSSGTYRKIFLTDGNNVLTGQKKTSIGGEKKSSNGLEEKFYPKEYYNNNTININNKEEEKKEKKPSPSPKKIIENLEYYQEFCQVLNYLSEKTDVKYNIPKDAEILKKYKNYILIKEILKDGNTPDSLILVINSKYNEWISDEKMFRYLVPSTLFRKSNFEKYIIQAQIKQKTNVSTKPETGYTPQPLTYKIF